MSQAQDKTLFEALIEKLLGAGSFNSEVEVPPAAILWTDPERQWEALIPRLRQRLPQLLSLGEYQPEKRTGTSLWLRCMIERALEEESYWPDGDVAILYLPGFSRQQIKDISHCPDELSLLVELQFRGAMWHQVNGKDWTIAALLMSKEGGLGLDVEKGDETKIALRKSLPRLADVPLHELGAQRITAQWLYELMHPDFHRDMLLWLDNPQKIRKDWDGDQWDTFRAQCLKTLGFDPDKGGELEAARLLGLHQGKWQEFWERYTESPGIYPNIANLLEQAKPTSKTTSADMFVQPVENWPQDNRECERQLREALEHSVKQAAPETRKRILELEKEHAARRQWVWGAKLGLAPLAHAIQHLAALVQRTEKAFGGETAELIAQQYVDGGWQADRAALDAYVTCTSDAERSAVTAVLRHIYLPWLDACCTRLQNAVESKGYPLKPGCRPDCAAQSDYTAFVYIDGLRYDLAQRLREQLIVLDMEAEISWSWAGLPTVTATCKPLAMPEVSIDPASPADTGFVPVMQGKPKKADTSTLHDELKKLGFEVLAAGSEGLAVGHAWLELGKLDKLGHDENAAMAKRIDTELRDAVARMAYLFGMGYEELVVVTDHGWLLMPGALEKKELASEVVENKWGRCAVLKPKASPDMLVVDWHWNPKMQIAMARGASAFFACKEYAHGGLSPQECIIPVLRVRKTAGSAKHVKITSINWTRLKGSIKVENGAGCTAEIRLQPGDPASRCSGNKKIEAAGTVTLYIDDDKDDLEGEEGYVVVLQEKIVVASQPTKIGE